MKRPWGGSCGADCCQTDWVTGIFTGLIHRHLAKWRILRQLVLLRLATFVVSLASGDERRVGGGLSFDSLIRVASKITGASLLAA